MNSGCLFLFYTISQNFVFKRSIWIKPDDHTDQNSRQRFTFLINLTYFSSLRSNESWFPMPIFNFFASILRSSTNQKSLYNLFQMKKGIVDPLSLLREYVSGKKPIKLSGESLVFGNVKLPLKTETGIFMQLFLTNSLESQENRHEILSWRLVALFRLPYHPRKFSQLEISSWSGKSWAQ